MKDLNLKFKDGNELVRYSDDSYTSPGCPTCGYGTEYISEIQITTTHNQIEMNFSNEDGYAFTVADAIRMLAFDLKKVTESEFIDYVKEFAKEYEGLTEFKVKERGK